MTSTLTAIDRCDRCNAQAYVRFEIPRRVPDADPAAFELLLCAHHDRENRDALLAKGARIIADDTLLLAVVDGLDRVVEQQRGDDGMATA